MEKQSLGMRVRTLRGEARREAITKVVAEYESSGPSAVAFCRSAGIQHQIDQYLRTASDSAARGSTRSSTSSP